MEFLSCWCKETRCAKKKKKSSLVLFEKTKWASRKIAACILWIDITTGPQIVPKLYFWIKIFKNVNLAHHFLLNTFFSNPNCHTYYFLKLCLIFVAISLNPIHFDKNQANFVLASEKLHDLTDITKYSSVLLFFIKVNAKAPLVSRALKEAKNSFYSTMFFISTWWGDCK